MPLDCQPSEAMPTDGIIVKIGGEDHAIFTTVCGGTRAPTGYRTGRKKGPHGVGELFRMGVLAGAAFRRR